MQQLQILYPLNLVPTLQKAMAETSLEFPKNFKLQKKRKKKNPKIEFCPG